MKSASGKRPPGKAHSAPEKKLFFAPLQSKKIAKHWFEKSAISVKFHFSNRSGDQAPGRRRPHPGGGLLRAVALPGADPANPGAVEGRPEDRQRAGPPWLLMADGTGVSG